MITHDYNGPGRWSAAEVTRRYQEYAERFGVSPVRDIKAKAHQKCEERWVHPVMYSIIDGIEEGDLACAQIGVEFIEEDQGFAFGAILKSNTARALRRFSGLTDEQITRIRARLVDMFLTGIVPREYRQYSRLLRKVGMGEQWPLVAAATPRNHHAAQAHRYFKSHCAPHGDGG